MGCRRHEAIFPAQSNTSICEDPMGPSGETLEELKDDMQYFLQALERPILKKEEIVFAPMGEEDEK